MARSGSSKLARFRRPQDGSLALYLVFALCVLIPLLATVGYFSGAFNSWLDQDSIEPTDPVLPLSTIISRPGAHISVDASIQHNPKADTDFFLSFWVRPKRLPEPGESHTLLMRYEAKERNFTGYAVSLENSAGEIRPKVYWRAPNGDGQWYTFGKVDIKAQEWVMFALSYYDGTKLGLHLGNISDRGESNVKLVGGFEFEKPIRPEPNRELSWGALKSSSFKGRFGPVMIAHTTGLPKILPELLSSLIRAPTDLPKEITLDQLGLFFTDGNNEKSPQRLPVHYKGIGNKLRMVAEKKKPDGGRVARIKSGNTGKQNIAG